MNRKFISLTLSAAMAVSMFSAAAVQAVDVSEVKVGVIYVGDENEGYTASHMKGIQEMKEALGLSDDQIIEKTQIPEDESCYDAAVDLAESGCNIIFATSFGHESYLFQAAAEYDDIQFAHATGTQAAAYTEAGSTNVHNYFTAIHEARYVAGVAAGMKLNEMIENGDIKEDEAKIGYVGAFPYAEVISGFSSFYLGAKSVCPTATMEVQYTQSWADMAKEQETAKKLISDNCVLISQHADTTGAPSACQELGVPCVGYNIDMTAVAPDVAITSPSNSWGPYYTEAVQCIIDGTEIPVDWCKGLIDGSCYIFPVNEKAAAPGTTEKLAEVEEQIKSGELKVYDTSTFTVDGGKTLEEAIEEGGDFAQYADYVSDGYFHESEFRSAPAFAMTIDGIDSQE